MSETTDIDTKKSMNENITEPVSEMLSDEERSEINDPRPEIVKLTQARVEARMAKLRKAMRINIADLPETIYHYTSAAGLYGMLSNNSIWLTHARSLNDSSEFLYGLNLIRSIAGKKPGSMAYEFCQSVFDWASNQISIIQSQAPMMAASNVVDAYFFCLCRSRDQLGQWRAYTPDAGGYALGFSTKDFQELLDESKTSMESVVYDNSTQEKIIEIYLEEYYNSLSIEPDPDNRAALYFTLQAGLTYEAYKFKHSGFAQEDEIRVMYDGDSTNYSIRVSQNYLIPFIERKMPTGRKLPIREIIVGPTSDYSRSIHGLVESLRLFEYKQVGIYTSEIPLRN